MSLRLKRQIEKPCVKWIRNLIRYWHWRGMNSFASESGECNEKSELFRGSELHDSSAFSNSSRKSNVSGLATGNTPVQWQINSKEFKFTCNSTPSKCEVSKYDQPAHKFMRKRRIMRNTLSGARPRPSNLQQCSSKLDLLDDQTLTSFPIPPPILNIGAASVSVNHPANEMHMRVHTADRRISYAPMNSQTQQEPESHPIVLIEDYIKQDEARTKFAKKAVSISDLRRKVSKRNDTKLPLKLLTNRKLSITSSLTLTPHLEDENSCSNGAIVMACEGRNTCEGESLKMPIGSFPEVENALRNIVHLSKDESKDRYLQALDIKSKIKYCVLCERPLYEVSQFMKDAEYQEIVCESCTSKYEQTAKLLEDYEFETSYEADTPTSSFQNEDLGEEPEPLVCSSNKRLKFNNFSCMLIDGLHLQLEDNIHLSKERVDCKTMLWFLEAKRKLRWRWRVKGLIPQFFASQKDRF
ncbi:LAMI_0E15566g1_1 [Lachancea mirantina]|uniref:LAMI_0E15566g1_1 n=1 Tax=Lachancea mirantina TaxID=1230905 RepID=A0A1G4JSS6_9SACH|nr:LAMI_0E15566g1_1 [Lachancea mirantina]